MEMESEFLFSSSGSSDAGLLFSSDEEHSNDYSYLSTVEHVESPAAEHFLGKHADSTMGDDSGSHDNGFVEQVAWPRGIGAEHVRTRRVC